VEDFTNQTGEWIEQQIDAGCEVELELGTLIAAASDWTEDETEIDDLVGGLIDAGHIQLRIGADPA